MNRRISPIAAMALALALGVLPPMSEPRKREDEDPPPLEFTPHPFPPRAPIRGVHPPGLFGMSKGPSWNERGVRSERIPNRDAGHVGRLIGPRYSSVLQGLRALERHNPKRQSAAWARRIRRKCRAALNACKRLDGLAIARHKTGAEWETDDALSRTIPWPGNLAGRG